MLRPVNSGPGTVRQEYLRQIQRVLDSQALHGAESLRKLLRYLCERSLEGPSEPVKEYQIATEAFGRSPDFDPQTDAAVRVQVRRLRSKLAKYYTSEGSHDPVVIEIPKGSYALSFGSRAEIVSEQAGIIPLTAGAPGTKPLPVAKRKKALGMALLVTCLVPVLLWNFTRQSPGVAAAAPPEILQRFWHPFLSSSDEPWVVFSNAAFVGRPETGMRYYRGGTGTVSGPISEHYTGVGEVLGVLDLDRMFARLGHTFRIKRASTFSIDDAQNSNLIFIGSPVEDLALLKLPRPHEFVFERIPSGRRRGDLGIANQNPQPGEEGMYLPSPPQAPLRVDYALIALTHGLDPGHSMLILAGTTTIGTQAAVDYVCQQNSLTELLRRLQIASHGGLPPFEAVIRVEVEQDTPLSTELVAVHKIE